jgi:hypothetical protein
VGRLTPVSTLVETMFAIARKGEAAIASGCTVISYAVSHKDTVLYFCVGFVALHRSHLFSMAQHALLGSNRPSLRQLIAYKRSRDNDAPRRLVAHNALYRKMKAPPRPPRSTLQIQWSPKQVAEEAALLDLLITKLILGDLAEQQHLHSNQQQL